MINLPPFALSEPCAFTNDTVNIGSLMTSLMISSSIGVCSLPGTAVPLPGDNLKENPVIVFSAINDATDNRFKLTLR